MSDSHLLKSNAKPSGDGRHVPEAHDAHKGHSEAGHTARNYKQELLEQKALSQAALVKIHDQLPLTTIGEPKHVAHMKSVEYGNGVKRDITFDKTGTVVRVYNPANHEEWKKGNYGWTISEPGHKPWHAKNMTVKFNAFSEELSWRVNSKESFKSLDKTEKKFHDPNAYLKKTEHSQKVSATEQTSGGVPIISMQKIVSASGNESQIIGGSQGPAFTNAEANRRALAAAGLSDDQIKNANVVFTSKEEWMNALKKSHATSIPGVDQSVVDSYSQLASAKDQSKPVGVFNKIIDLDKKVLHAVIKGSHGDQANAQAHDGKFHHYYESLEKTFKSYLAWSKNEIRETLGRFPNRVSDAEKIAVAVVAQGETPRKSGQSHEDRMGSVNIDPNRKAGWDFGLLQNNQGSEAAQQLVKAMHKEDPVLFKHFFGNQSDLVLHDIKHALAYSDVRKHMQEALKAYGDVQLKNGADRFQDTRRVLAKATNANYGQYGDNLKVLTLAFVLKNRFSPREYADRLNNVDLSGAKNSEDALVHFSAAFCHKVDPRTGKTLHDGRLNADKELALVNSVVPDVDVRNAEDVISWAP